jgi:hypothetical protein
MNFKALQKELMEKAIASHGFLFMIIMREE